MRTIKMTTYEVADLERILKKYIDYKETHRYDNYGKNNKWNDTDYEIERANILLKRLNGYFGEDYDCNSLSYTREPKIKTTKEKIDSMKRAKPRKVREDELND